MMTYEIWGDDSGPCCLIPSTSHWARSQLKHSFGCELLKTFDANGWDEANQVFSDLTECGEYKPMGFLISSLRW